MSTPTTARSSPSKTSTSRVPLEHPGSKLARVMNFWTRRSYGQEMEPMLALLHNRKVVTSVARFEMDAAKLEQVVDWRSSTRRRSHLRERRGRPDHRAARHPEPGAARRGVRQGGCGFPC